ncbi:MAG: AAA family ATPase [Candidatus Acidiferrum sp.]
MLGREQIYRFSSFTLDAQAGRLAQGGEFKPLRPKSFALLYYLVTHPGELVTKDQLLAALWPDVAVGDEGLSVCIHEVRQALGDRAQHPRFIETAHRRGYRFIASVTTPDGEEDGARALRVSAPLDDPVVVGREAEMLRLRQSWERALDGSRQILLIGGEPGVGKSTLTHLFLDFVKTSTSAFIGSGQSSELYGKGEAYLPILDALKGICEGQMGQDARHVLRRRAPAWLAYLPGMLEPAQSNLIGMQSAGMTQERLLRDMAEALELLTTIRPVVLVLEDLHLSDSSTLKLLSFMAQRREAARLMIIGTYRTGEPSRQGDPFPQLLQEMRRGQPVHEIYLEGLREAAVADYLRSRLRTDGIPANLAHQVYRRTGGNSLFMTAIAEQLRANGIAGHWPYDLGESGVPGNIRQTILSQIERLSGQDQRLLEVASVAGAEFSAAAVAAGFSEDTDPLTTDQIEQRCEELARTSPFLHPGGFAQWPNGTIAAGYGFRHALYEEVLYDGVSSDRKRRLHQAIGERLEAAYGEQAVRIAAELAVHFERGGENRRAVKYLTLSARTALSRSASQEAVTYAHRALELLVGATHCDQQRQELELQLLLGSAHISTSGYAAEKVEQAFRRAHELVVGIGETPSLLPALHGLAKFYLVRREMRTALAIATQCLDLAQATNDLSATVAADENLAAIFFARGEFGAALAHAQRCIKAYDPEKHRRHALIYGMDSWIAATAYAASCLWHLGYPDQAKRRSLEAVARGYELSHPNSAAFAIAAAATIRANCRDWVGLHLFAERLIAYTAAKGVPFWHGWGVFYRGQALTQQGELAAGLNLMRMGIVELGSTGADSMHARVPAILTEVATNAKTAEEGIRAVAEATAESERTTQLYDHVEHNRILGVLNLRTGESRNRATIESQAQECFLKAKELSRRQSAKSSELRVTIDLSRLWQRQGKKTEARQALKEIYGWFTEGFNTRDLQEAKTLLEELA